MTFGEKLKEARNIAGLSQEKFAEKLNISRAAVAKWERDKGIPDVTNLKSISKLLNVSIDYLLDERAEITPDIIQISNNEESSVIVISDKVERMAEYQGYYWSIELTGWNDGVSNAIILGQDNDFVYYQRVENKKSILGMLGKKYITAIEKEKVCKEESDDITIDRYYFLDKHVQLEIAHKEGLIKGFFDFTNDDYLDVVIKKFDIKEVVLALGNTIDIGNITKIELNKLQKGGLL